MNESAKVRNRYERRAKKIPPQFYSMLRPYNLLALQEVERVIIRWINECGIGPVEEKKLLEVGCGSGSQLLDFLRMGFRPENLVGNELLEERAKAARERLPAALRILTGDAMELEPPGAPFDIVLQATVFTSLLDHTFQQKLADRMWELTRPGGGVLWYDFVYSNPKNPDVAGVPIRQIRKLFPEGKIRCRRLTLAPPISRRVCRIHPCLYHVFNLFPFLRTHVLCWIEKRA